MYYLKFVSDSRKSHNLQDGPSLAETPTGQQKGELKLLNPHNHCNFCIMVREEETSEDLYLIREHLYLG
jgi:hypothetical protein